MCEVEGDIDGRMVLKGSASEEPRMPKRFANPRSALGTAGQRREGMRVLQHTLRQQQRGQRFKGSFAKIGLTPWPGLLSLHWVPLLESKNVF